MFTCTYLNTCLQFFWVYTFSGHIRSHLAAGAHKLSGLLAGPVLVTEVAHWATGPAPPSQMDGRGAGAAVTVTSPVRSSHRCFLRFHREFPLSQGLFFFFFFNLSKIKSSLGLKRVHSTLEIRGSIKET